MIKYDCMLVKVSEEYDELFRRQASAGGKMEARFDVRTLQRKWTLLLM